MAFGIDVSQAELRLEEYPTFGSFFARRLQAGLRPVDAADDAVVWPVDGRVVNWGAVERGRVVQAKGVDYTLAELVGSEQVADRFEGGQQVTVHLRPRDYHRIHCPVDGEIRSTRRIAGTLLPVKPSVVRNLEGLFTSNERLVVELETAVGKLLLVAVGAMGVGSIPTFFGAGDGYQRHEPPLRVAKGQELAAFNLGSTVIVVFQRGSVTLEPLQESQQTRVGRVLARRRVARVRVA